MQLETYSTSFQLEGKSAVKSDTEMGEFGFFEGYASTFNNLDRHEDVILPGAFTDSLAKGPQIKLLWEHDMSDLIGSIPEATEDSRGLRVKGRINLGTEKGREAYALLKAGDLDTMSIGYVVKDYEMDLETRIRKLKKLEVHEVSLVAFPANPRATVMDVKSLDDTATLSDIEEILRKRGKFSQNEAKAIIARVKRFSRKSSTEDDADQKTANEAVIYAAATQQLKALNSYFEG